MKKRSLFTILPIFVLPVVTISCNSSFNFKQNQKILIFNSRQHDFREIFTQKQLQILNKYIPLFSNGNLLNVEVLDDNIKINDNLYSYKGRKPYVLNFAKKNDFEYIQVSKRGTTKHFDYNMIFEDLEYIFDDDIKHINSWPSISGIFNKICSISLHDAWNMIIPNFITPTWIRAKAWIKNTEQISYWEDLILFYLSNFDFGDLPKINRVKITPVEAIEKNIVDSDGCNIYKNAPIIQLDFLDNNGVSLLDNTIRDNKYIIGKKSHNGAEFLLEDNDENRANYISIFKNYNSKNDYLTTLNIMDDEILFNEYVNTNFYADSTLLKLNDEMFIKNNYYESYVSPGNDYELVTARSFLWFLENKKDGFYIDVPEFRRHIDKEYKIKSKKIHNKDNKKDNKNKENKKDNKNKENKKDNIYLNYSLNLIELEIEVTKQNNEKPKTYKWYSIDINNHYHDFNSYKTTLDFDFYAPPENKYGWNPTFAKNNPQKDYPITKFITPDEFYEKLLLKLMSVQIYKFANNLKVFDGEIMANYEAYKITKNKKPIELLKSYLGLDIFKYLISKSTNKDDLLHDIKIEFKGVSKTKPGTIELKVDFLDSQGKSMLSLENREKVIEWNGFKGSDNTHRLSQTSAKFSLPFLLENKNKNFKEENILDFFEWKE
ncbi:Uncharacterised protein [Mycoplasmopsis californica]|nr:Uncharacterised protein [Mycoplasmopsis californica]